ncbi:MAG: RDD family protein [Luteolibacter sp.]
MEVAAEKLDTLQSVELAEGIEIRLRIAGPGLRSAAYALDILIFIGCIIVVNLGLILGGIALGGDVVTGFQRLAFFLLFWWYPVIFEAGKRGATPGKRAFGLRVVQTSGAPITVSQAIIRNFLRYVDGMPFPIPGVPYMVTYGFGLASCLATKRFQRLGDLAAGTVVIYDRIPPEPIVTAPPPMTALPPPVLLSADEVRALVVFRERAGLWSEARRIEIADHAAELSGGKGPLGVSRLMSMAHWLQEKRER